MSRCPSSPTADAASGPSAIRPPYRSRGIGGAADESSSTMDVFWPPPSPQLPAAGGAAPRAGRLVARRCPSRERAGVGTSAGG